MQKKFISIILLVTLLFGAFIFRSKNSSDEVIFWTLQMGNYSDYINRIINEYEKDNNVKIKWIDVPFSEGEKRTLSAVLSSNPPDLINLNPDFSALLAQKGALAEIDRSQLKDFNDEIVDSLSYNGKIYAIPWYATSAITFYNKNLLQSNSLPKTYKDLMKIKKMNAYVFMPAISENDTMLKILNKYGISSYADINSEKSVKVFKMFKDMYNSGLIPKESVTQTHREALEKYMSGQIIFFQAGANFLNMVKENSPLIYEQTQVMPQLIGDLGQYDFSLMNFVIPYKSKHQKEALSFALYLTNEKNQLELAKMTNVIATNKKALNDKFYKEKGKDLMSQARVISALQLNNVNPVLKQQRNQKEINLLVNTAVQNILINNADIQKTLDETAQKWKEIIQ